MVLWRISIFHDLQGMGGEFGNGRWHTPAKAKRIVYLTEHPAVSLLEVLVNLKSRPKDGADEYQLLRIGCAEEVEAERIVESSLVSAWREKFAATQAIGDEWLKSQRTALLAVPSAPSPESTNYLLNPLHPDARKFKIDWRRWLRYDERFFRVSE